jgi:hypothetical protein
METSSACATRHLLKLQRVQKWTVTDYYNCLTRHMNAQSQCSCGKHQIQYLHPEEHFYSTSPFGIQSTMVYAYIQA